MYQQQDFLDIQELKIVFQNYVYWFPKPSVSFETLCKTQEINTSREDLLKLLSITYTPKENDTVSKDTFGLHFFRNKSSHLYRFPPALLSQIYISPCNSGIKFLRAQMAGSRVMLAKEPDLRWVSAGSHQRRVSIRDFTRKWKPWLSGSSGH